MGQGVLRNMQVHPDPSLPEPGVGLHIDGAGGMEWQTP